jgi:hypothetical protein
MAHKLTYKTDPDGREVVGIALSNVNRRAWLYRQDYERIVADHGVGRWFVNHNGTGRWYVRLKGRDTKNNHQAARLVFGFSERTGLHYRDQNPFNLRRSNLEVDVGSGGTRHKRRWTPNEATAARSKAIVAARQAKGAAHV